MSGNNQYHLAKRMRWAARIIGLTAAGFSLLMIIGSTVAEVLAEGWNPIDANIVVGSLMGILGAIGLAGCIVSWWRERLASILLVLTAIGFGIHIGLFAGRNHFLVWLMMGFPYLIASVLFFYSWRLSGKTLGKQKAA